MEGEVSAAGRLAVEQQPLEFEEGFLDRRLLRGIAASPADSISIARRTSSTLSAIESRVPISDAIAPNAVEMCSITNTPAP